MAWRAYYFGAKPTAWLCAAMVLTMGLLPELLRPLFGNRFALAWHPAMTLVFLAILAWPQRERSAAGTVSMPPAGTQT